MTQSKKIAVTGGIGSGKSTVMALLEEMGYPGFSCDEIYAELCKEPAFLEKLGALFKGTVKDGALDRSALSRAVFSDAEALRRLNALAHPAIAERLLFEMEPYPLSFAEVPLLYESGLEENFDGVISVMRDRESRIEAVKERSGLSREEIVARMAAQRDWNIPPKDSFVLENDGGIAALRAKLKEIVAKIV